MTGDRLAKALWPDGFGRDHESGEAVSTWKIDKDIPIPKPRSGVPQRTRYDFANMKVGDSYLELVGDDYAPTVRQRLCSAAWAFRHRHPPNPDALVTDPRGETPVQAFRVA